MLDELKKLAYFEYWKKVRSVIKAFALPVLTQELLEIVLSINFIAYS